ncbi:protein FAR1-RELATED SEQUENCE 5-like [Salvia miltiorrhiza]|uniref:protein FAR1-RELATED SEQUENCE 5-like n=1 Tax=Salvia miltiorrhiza TaxID=226208 RepID=UPI0025ABFE94|nr:protein FAR1-RELATED SEQUENCE 5-like [Salvia miltiorrhiza]
MSTQDSVHLDLETTDVEDFYVPQCDDILKPTIGQKFDTLEDGVSFYRAYASACGFTIRKSSKEDVKVKHVDQGAKKQKRKRVSCRVHCMARVGYRFVAGSGYEIYKFIEGHTHKLASEGLKHLLKVHRNIDYGHQFFMAKCFKANIGAVRSFKIYSELVGGVDDAGCRKIDFKNHSRDVKSWANGVDYDVDESNKLTRLFWADAVSIENYKIFGQAISFDATYNTNRYSLIFTPFTGKDDHGRCVTFGAGLISREDEESYSWILSTFVKCMGSQPTMIITDQDLGMRAAIAKG